MVYHFGGVGKMFSRKGLLYNWEEIAEFSQLFAVVGKKSRILTRCLGVHLLYFSRKFTLLLDK